MKSTFRGYYSPTDDDLESLWTHGLLILDTNALLNLFRYSAKTRDEFLATLRERTDNLWIPNHVGAEFHRHRLGVIHEQKEAFSEILTSLESAERQVIAKLKKFSRHPSLEANSLIGEATKHFKEISDVIANASKVYDASPHELEDERTFAAISKLFDGRVGDPWADDKLKNLYADGSVRYDAKRPPGFGDAKKPEPERYGDLLIWEQILEHAREVKRPAIFVTDDGKPDWWHIAHGKTLGPRPELVSDYYEASDSRVHFYSPERFLSFANKRGLTVSQESLTEIEELSTAQKDHEARQRAARDTAMRMVRRIAEQRRERTDSDKSRALLARLERLTEEQTRLRRRRNTLEHHIAELHLPDNQYDDSLIRSVMEAHIAERHQLEHALTTITEEMDDLRDELLGQGRLSDLDDHRATSSANRWSTLAWLDPSKSENDLRVLLEGDSWDQTSLTGEGETGSAGDEH